LKGRKGISCKEIFSLLSMYLDKELDGSSCEWINRHVKNCKPCKAFLNTLRKTIRLCNKFKPEYKFRIQRVKPNKDLEEEIKTFTHFFRESR
jgi:predicted anti-sigma-YlaC factor YlaD